jgi:hypothetical protein
MVIKIKLNKPEIRSIDATKNASFLVEFVQFFICSIRNTSPPIEDGRKIPPYAEREYPFAASEIRSFPIGE